MRTSPQNKQVLPKFFRRNIVSLQNRQAAPVCSRTQSHLYRIGKLQHFILARRAFASLYDILLHARSLPVLPASGSALQPAGQLYFLLKRSAGTVTDIFSESRHRIREFTSTPPYGIPFRQPISTANHRLSPVARSVTRRNSHRISPQKAADPSAHSERSDDRTDYDDSRNSA